MRTLSSMRSLNEPVISTNSSFKATAETAKKGNVFALLNTLYESGLGAVSPINPLLTGRTMHTLYAVSFIIYFGNSLVDWFHVYFILTGRAISFPLEPWFSIMLVFIAVIGSMLNLLLMALCMENAFVQRLNVAPYRNGLSVVVEAFVEWIQSFNNFRVTFLVMILRDLPWTIVNYLLVTSCRWPELAWHYSLFLSSFSIIISLCWRIVMLYYSYRRLIFGDKNPRKSSMPVKPLPGIYESIKLAIDIKEEPRLDELDESWPIRYAISKIYGLHYQRYTTKIYLPDEEDKPLIEKISEWISIGICRTFACLKFSFKRTLCAALAFLIYCSWACICCFPCLWFYFCRKDSLNHRHKCSRSFVRLCTLFYHYVLIVFSLLGAITLISLNGIIITSTHVRQWNNLPPSLNHLCLEFDPIHSTITPSLSSTNTPAPRYSQVVCKNIWDHAVITEELIMMKPWQARFNLGSNKMLIVLTFIHNNISSKIDPFYSIYYDHAVLRVKTNRLQCPEKHERNSWRFDETLHLPSYSYFLGCIPSFSVFRYNGISC